MKTSKSKRATFIPAAFSDDKHQSYGDAGNGSEGRPLTPGRLTKGSTGGKKKAVGIRRDFTGIEAGNRRFTRLRSRGDY